MKNPPNKTDVIERTEVYCLHCDETFFAFKQEELCCPKCGTKEDEWLNILPTQVDEHEGKTQDTTNQPMAP